MNSVCEIDRFQIVEITINRAAEIFIWDHDCIRFLREECRIFGKFIGTVARLPHKTTFKGLPIMLGIEELVVLLKEQPGCVRLVISVCIVSPSVSQSSQSSINQYKSDLECNYNELSTIIHEVKLGRSNLHFANVGETVTTARKRKADGASVDISPSTVPTLEQVIVHLPTGTPTDWLRTCEKETIDVPELSTLAESLDFVTSLMKCKFDRETDLDVIVKTAVFHNLWSKGHCVTISCKKMGGDPWLNHATHVVRIQPQTLEIRPPNLISKIRLISSLKKTYLIAWYNGDVLDKSANISRNLENLNISFNSLSWCGSVP